MVCSFTDYNVFGWFGVFLLPYETRKKQMGTTRKRLHLIRSEHLPFSDGYAKYLAANGLAPCLQQRGLLSRRSVLACWECEEAFTDISEGDDVCSIHQRLSPRCKTAQQITQTRSFWTCFNVCRKTAATTRHRQGHLQPLKGGIWQSVRQLISRRARDNIKNERRCKL